MLINKTQAVQLLLTNNVVALPTETVYGLAARVASPSAIAEIFHLKGRPQNNPLIIHLSSTAELPSFIREAPPHTDQLAAHFWPGPLTLILPINETSVPAIARANLSTAGFRVPAHPAALEILQQTGPLVAPSANLSGKPSPTTADHVLHDFAGKISVLDGGACVQGVESTILIFSDNVWQIARLGALPPDAFLPILGYTPQEIRTQKVLCPGKHYKHYAPQAKLLLSSTPYALEAEVVVGYSDRTYPGAKQLFALGCTDKPQSALNSLYATLRELDQQGIALAWVDFDIPNTGLWLTLRERLQRAAQRI